MSNLISYPVTPAQAIEVATQLINLGIQFSYVPQNGVISYPDTTKDRIEQPA